MYKMCRRSSRTKCKHRDKMWPWHITTDELLLVTDGCWDKKSLFSPGMCPPRGYPLSSRCPYTQAHTDSTQWTRGSFQRKHIKLVEDQREELEGMALTKTLHLCMKVFNNISLKIESSKNQGNFYMVRNKGRRCIQCVHVGKKDTDQVTSASLSFGV